jgi:hypothetical protein
MDFPQKSELGTKRDEEDAVDILPPSASVGVTATVEALNGATMDMGGDVTPST